MSKLGIWIPHSLSEQNKEDCISRATSLLSKKRNDPFPKNRSQKNGSIVTRMNLHIQPTKADPHEKKVMLCVWWDHQGIIPFEFLNCIQRLNADSLLLQYEHKSLLRKFPPPYSSIGKTTYFSMITQGYIQQESCKTKILDFWFICSTIFR